MLGIIKGRLTCSAKITRADGSVEDLGVISARNLKYLEILKLRWLGIKNKIQNAKKK